MFTGSTATGKKIMAEAAKTLTPVSLELGGKDPMIVLSDADLERAANTAVYAGMMNGGQTCISIERVYVEAPVYDEFVAKVTEKAKALRQGVPAVDLIDFEYACFHRTCDNTAQIHEPSLDAVGETMMKLLPTL